MVQINLLWYNFGRKTGTIYIKVLATLFRSILRKEKQNCSIKLASRVKKREYPLQDQILGPRGAKPKKKKAILNKIAHFMNENRRVFWQSVPSSLASVNLLKHGSVSWLPAALQLFSLRVFTFLKYLNKIV
jgi:hypothetical protein